MSRKVTAVVLCEDKQSRAVAPANLPAIDVATKELRRLP